METRCARVKIKNGSLEAVREWARTINGRREEALETLRDESVRVESVFLESAPDGDFLIYYLRGPDLAHSDKVGAASKHPIDAYHYAFMRQHTEKGIPLEMLIDLET
jgi:hypothetical protein